ncbi:hypothetical protein AB0P21_25955 [Kribbella sp. NPDC056861]|uniref:hypothetical protein n=1 Tax=Kribbella sp. NPDC056861 TaxID=3154857 RepID=UPI003425D7AF
MSLRTELVEQLSRYDDDAWAALANRGLLRRARKDLTAVQPEVIADEPAGLEIQVGSARVRFGADGPARAVCDCASSSVCQHIITAGLWLLTSPAAPESTPPDSPVADGLTAELLDFDVDQLVKHAGRAGFRWALQYVDDLDLGSDVRVESGRQFVLTLTSPRVTFRFMGGGLAGLVPDSKLTNLEKYQVAAVLAFQRLSGVGPPPAERVEKQTPRQLADSRVRLRAAVKQLLTDTVRLGIAHVSGSIHQRYETLAVWAQGAEYHRLARSLRRLADHVELLLDRSARADEHRLLDESALVYALVCALDQAEPPRLVGQARGRYDVVRRMDVIGLGAYPWRAASGYHGLTALFWWPAEKQFVAWTDARPDSMPAFDPRASYRGVAGWEGLASPADATGADVRLSDAKLSPSGRLSGAESTRAAAVKLSGEAIAAGLPVVTHWSELARQPRSLLDEPAPLADWSVLRPAAFGQPVFHPNHQSLSWEILDQEGETLTLVLPYSAENAHAIQRIESLTADDLAPGTLLVAQLRPTPTGLSGEPMSLIHPGCPAGEAVEPLHFSTANLSQKRKFAFGKVRQSAGDAPTTGVRTEDDLTAALLPPALVELRGWLVRQAERGAGGGAQGTLVAELESRHQLVRAVGFGIFGSSAADSAPAGIDPAVAILRSCYLLQQVTQVLSQRNAFVVKG